MSREIGIRYFWQHDDTGAWTVHDTNLGVIETLEFWSHFQNLEMRHTLIARCQFTGLTDKNGKDVFEGHCVRPFLQGVAQDPVTVYYDGHAFWMNEVGYEDGQGGVWYHDVEIIGNRFEHPHLLEAKP